MIDLTAMTFNVRQMDGDDGPQAWPHRRDVLIETLRLYPSSLVGTQETWDEQTSYILHALPGYKAFGRGRFGDLRDKHNKVFYDTRRFALLETGDIWISRSPDVPGSKDWGIPSPRMISWGLLRLDGSTPLMVMNTHFPYGREADEARRQTARLILEHIATLPAKLPVILMGDFNARPNGEIHQMLCTVLQDAWETAEHTKGPEGTVHGFGRVSSGHRIDWILYRNLQSVLATETVTYRSEGLYPSDHFPVMMTASIDIPSSAA